MKLILGLALSLLIARGAVGEDMDLRNRAEQLVNRSIVASRFTTPMNIRTEVTFSATGVDGIATSGSYVRTRSVDNALREDLVLGDYSMSRMREQSNVATHGQWVDIPYPLRKVMDYVPYMPIRFDPTDVITSIDQTKMNGKAAVCIQFVTVRGEDRNPGDVCVSRDNGTVIEWHDRDRSFQALEYGSVKDALLPSHFVYREGEKLVIDASVRWTLLDARPDDAFVAPEDWRHARICKSFAMPVPKSAPQPAAKGGVDAPVITVDVRVHVRPDGTVGKAEVLKPVRDDLDAEALELVKTWTYQPGVCEGNKQDFAIDAAVYFQGR
ncbi:MAG: TonB family protein [Terracidiphilus sp.]|jgi:TonB family protein